MFMKIGVFAKSAEEKIFFAFLGQTEESKGLAVFGADLLIHI